MELADDGSELIQHFNFKDLTLMKDESHPDGWQFCCYDAFSVAVSASAPNDVGGSYCASKVIGWCVDSQTSDWAVSELPHTALKEARKQQG